MSPGLTSAAAGLAPSTMAEWGGVIVAVFALAVSIVAIFVGVAANRHAKRAATTATGANILSGQANTLAIGANDLADKANVLATDANGISGQVLKNDVLVREQAQARLVYAAIEEDPMLWLQDREVLHLPTPLDWSSLVGLEKPLAALFDYRTPPFENIWAVQELTVVDVTVNNLSDEVVAEAEVRLFHPDEASALDVYVMTGALVPKSSVTVQFVLAGARSGYQPIITFLDSGGKWWTRRAFEPMAETQTDQYPTQAGPPGLKLFKRVDTEERKPEVNDQPKPEDEPDF